MWAPSAALSVAAAAALSGAAAGSPCGATTLIPDTISGSSCVLSEQGAEAAAPDDRRDPITNDLDEMLLGDQTAPAVLVETDALDYPQVRITNLQATMTSNRYVAGHIPPAPRAGQVDELMMYAPDYSSVRLLPRPQGQKPVGVGLVTLPKSPVKKSDIPPGAAPPPKTTP